MFNFYPDKTFSRTDVMSRPTPVPAVNGIYFWWFKEIPSGVPTEGCITQNGYTLLYVGISPDKKGKPNSRANLRQRIKTHYSGNAEGSTLRRTRKAISRSVGLARERERHLPTLASNGWTSGWKRMQKYIG